ncbi:MAG: hypothetical protein ACK55I_43015, partial [bacterium]
MAKKFAVGLHTVFSGHLGDVCRGLEPQAWHTRLHEIFQQVAVIAGDLDHEAGGIEAEPLPVRLAGRGRVTEQGIAEGREVEVVAEEVDGWDDIRDLQ